jgi:amino acid permease
MVPWGNWFQRRSILPAYESANTSTRQHFPFYLQISIIFRTAVYFAIGFVGYLCFRDDLDVDVLTNFSSDVSSKTLKAIGTFFQCAVIYPL